MSAGLTRTKNRIPFLFFLLLAGAGARAADRPAAPQGVETEISWSPQLLHDPRFWREGAKELATVGKDGLRLMVDQGHTWELVAQDSASK